MQNNIHTVHENITHAFVLGYDKVSIASRTILNITSIQKDIHLDSL